MLHKISQCGDVFPLQRLTFLGESTHKFTSAASRKKVSRREIVDLNKFRKICFSLKEYESKERCHGAEVGRFSCYI